MKSIIPEKPFSYLVQHFARRLFASDNEQDGGTVGVGVGVVLAILASPGAFASIFLMDKYSTVLQFIRGQRGFDPYRASIADEYFFVVLSMTITGLVMVLRWNRLLPDRRDFANLAILPIPSSHIFLANFCALLGLGLLFAIDVNAVSSILFPIFVGLRDDTFAAILRVAISHAITVFWASIFSFFCVFALVGLLMLILPSSWFKPVSLVVRILLVVGLLTELFSNLFLQLMAGRIPQHADAYMRWLPSFWFLGIYEQHAGLASPAMIQLAHQAVTMLVIATVVALISYTLCYHRYFLRLAESSSDNLGHTRKSLHWKLPGWIERAAFRTPFEHAWFGFVLRVLCRNERHLMFFGGYLGVGLVMVAGTAFDGVRGQEATAVPSSDVLAVPLLLSFFLITGLRFAFDMTASAEANWVFRIATTEPQPSPQAIARRFLWMTVLPWQLFLWSPFVAHRYGWYIALLHIIATISLTGLVIDIALIRFHKIPFTCLKEMEVRQLLLRVLSCVLTVVVAVPFIAGWEHWALRHPARYGFFALVIGFAWYWAKRKQEDVIEQPSLTFEDRPQAPFELLKLA